MKIICLIGSDVLVKRQIAMQLSAYLTNIGEEFCVVDMYDVISREIEEKVREVYPAEDRVMISSERSVGNYRDAFSIIDDRYWAFRAVQEMANSKARGGKNIVLIGLESRGEHHTIEEMGATMVLVETKEDTERLGYIPGNDDSITFWSGILCSRDELLEKSVELGELYLEKVLLASVDEMEEEEEVDVDDTGDDSDRWDNEKNDMGYV